MIPQTFEEWKDCIVYDCNIKLTKEFAQKRLAVYQNSKNKETQDFVKLYGRQHLKNIINWYKKVS